MKVVFDHQIFAEQKYGGISRYIVSLANELIKLDGNELKINFICPMHKNVYLSSLNSEIKLFGVRIPDFRGSSKVMRMMCEGLVPSILRHLDPDIVHRTYYYPWKRGSRRIRNIVTVHDMIHELFPDHFRDSDPIPRLKKYAIECADHVICISNNTKNDLCNILNIPESKISVVHHGYFQPSNDNIYIQSNESDRPFLLYVGERSGYKNFKGLVSAVGSAKDLRDNFDIIAFGGRILTSEEQEFISSSGLPVTSVRQIQGDDALLASYYRAATAFVYPSLYEGFGLPLLEAMAHRCPVISSNTSSMPEVAGSAAVYFDPGNIDSQVDAIRNVVFNAERRRYLIEEGVKRLNGFSWERCAKETMSAYLKI